MAIANAINAQTAGIQGMSSAGVWTGTAATNHAVIVGGATASTLTNVGPSATAGQVLQSAGASADPVFSTATYPAATVGTGKILYDNGTNFVTSVPTFPASASATSRKMIVSDGTNWVASTETWAVPGTSGNVLTSNGTNWTSAAPAASSGASYMMVSGVSGTLGDGTTYFLAYGIAINSNANSGAGPSRIYFTNTGTITKCYGAFCVQGTLASSENVSLSIRLNNTTDTTISSTIQLTAASVPFNNTGISIAVVAGDFIEFKMVNPSFGTNPSSVSFSASIAVS